MKKILLVEDDHALRESMKLVLEEAPFEVVAFADGKQALKELQITKFDAAIFDDNIPFIQGSDLLGLVKIQSPDIFIIIMSGLFNEEGIKKIMSQGADLVIEKPFELKDIIDYLNVNLK